MNVTTPSHLRSKTTLHHTACYLCQQTLNVIFARVPRNQHIYLIAYCPTCRLYQTITPPDKLSPDYVNLEAEHINKERLWCQGAHKHNAFKQWETIMKKHLTDLSTHSLLDVGCGTGGFLSFAKAIGFDSLYGYDVSAAQVTHAQTRFSNVRVATDPVDYNSEFSVKMSFVTMWDVAEHLRDPIAVFSRLRACMEDNGILFVSVPNGNSLSLKEFIYQKSATFLNSLIPWEHVFYYTPHSLSRILHAGGFSVLHIGAVCCYHRKLDWHEAARRLGHTLLSCSCNYAPQIYAVARPTRTFTTA